MSIMKASDCFWYGRSCTLGSSPAPRVAPPAAAPLEIPAEELDLAQMLVEAGVPLIEIAEQLPSVAGRANAAHELAKVLERGVRRDGLHTSENTQKTRSVPPLVRLGCVR